MKNQFSRTVIIYHLFNFFIFTKKIHFRDYTKKNLLKHTNHEEKRLAQLESDAALNGVQQLLAQLTLVVVFGELQEVQARARRHESIEVVAAVLDAERRVQVFESQQRRPRTARHELQQLPALIVVERPHHLPKHFHGFVVRVVVTAVARVIHQVVDVHRDFRARYQHLQLLRVEHVQPGNRQDVRQSCSERLALLADLPVQLEVRHELNVLDPVTGVDDDVGTIRFQLHHARLAEVITDNSKVQLQLLKIILAVSFQLHQIFVHVGIQRGQLVNVDDVGLSAGELGKEKLGERKLHEEILEQRLAQHPPDEEIVPLVVLLDDAGTGVGVQHVVLGQNEESAVGVERSLDELAQELAEDSAAVDARFLQLMLVDHLHAEAGPQVRLVLRRKLVERVLVQMSSTYGEVSLRTLKESLHVS